MNLLNLPPELLEPIMEQVALSQSVTITLRARLACKSISDAISSAILSIASTQWATGNGSPFFFPLSDIYITTVLVRGAFKIYNRNDNPVLIKLTKGLPQHRNPVLNNIDRAVMRLLEVTKQQGDGSRLAFTQAAAECVTDWAMERLRADRRALDEEMADPPDPYSAVQDNVRRACCAIAAWMGRINLVAEFMVPDAVSYIPDTDIPEPLSWTINKRCRFFTYPLYAAARQGHLSIVRFLLGQGAQPFAGECSKMGRPVDDVGVARFCALEAAARGGHLECVGFLLKYLDAMLNASSDAVAVGGANVGAATRAALAKRSTNKNGRPASPSTSSASIPSTTSIAPPLLGLVLPALEAALTHNHAEVAKTLLNYFPPDKGFDSGDLYRLLSAAALAGRSRRW